MSNKPKWMKKNYLRDRNVSIVNPYMIIEPHESPEGTYVELEDDNGHVEKYFVDEIIAKSFIPRPPSDVELKVLHLNGDIHDNSISNLAWCLPDDPRYIEMMSNISDNETDK